MVKDDFHVDMSGRINKNKTIGIALLGTKTGENYGCALKGNLIKLIKKRLFKKNLYIDSAKLYAICIFLLAKEIKGKIDTLIICNDEDFKIVKQNLIILLKNYDFEIIDIGEFRKRLGRNIGFLADNYANIYRRRALKPNRMSGGRELKIIKVTYKIIEKFWTELKNDETK